MKLFLLAAAHIHPTVACEMLQIGASRAVGNLKDMLEVTFLVADMAEMALWVRGVERVGPRTITISCEDLLELYRMFVTVVTLTRSLVDR